MMVPLISTLFLRLGASLYVPATHGELAQIARREKLPALRSIIFCTEDAVRPDDLDLALLNLDRAIATIDRDEGPVLISERPLRFVRVRNPEVVRRVLSMDGADRIDGLVLPKVTATNLEGYFAAIGSDSTHRIMITLETREVFNPLAMRALAELLLEDRFRSRILSLRIGGNDLLNLLALRRPRNGTIYDTPVGRAISDLVATFRPYGFNLTAPVYDGFDDARMLVEEVDRDLASGTFGKTAIHPRQVPLIESRYRVPREDVEAAERVLDGEAPAAFKLHGQMWEPTTHSAWARLTLERAALYGVT